jgi:hypothetical protein
MVLAPGVLYHVIVRGNHREEKGGLLISKFSC